MIELIQRCKAALRILGPDYLDFRKLGTGVTLNRLPGLLSVVDLKRFHNIVANQMFARYTELLAVE